MTQAVSLSKFLWGVLTSNFIQGIEESITANVITVSVLYIGYRYLSKESSALMSITKRRSKPWLAAWVAYDKEPNVWVTETVIVRQPFLRRHMKIESKPITSVSGVPYNEDTQNPPIYHWHAICTVGADETIDGHWKSHLQPVTCSGRITLDIVLPNTVVGKFYQKKGLAEWSGPLIMCQNLEYMERLLRKEIQDENILTPVLENLRAISIL